MSVTHVVGVDPGLVHTGVVRMIFDPNKKVVEVHHKAIAGADASAVHRMALALGDTPHIFIEKYQPRSNLNTDTEMVKAVQELKRVLPNATILLNTGVKKVVKKPLMELLEVWSFPTVTNHQDLRSAARIALLGMLKSEPMNRLLSDVVRDHLAGESWHVRH